MKNKMGPAYLFNKKCYHSKLKGKNLLDVLIEILNDRKTTKVDIISYVTAYSLLKKIGALNGKVKTRIIVTRLNEAISKVDAKKLLQDSDSRKKPNINARQLMMNLEQEIHHLKLILIEQKVKGKKKRYAIIGSSNHTFAGFSSNLETNAILSGNKGSDSSQLWEIFNNLWNRGSERIEPESFTGKHVNDSPSIRRLLPFQLNALKSLKKYYVEDIHSGALLTLPTGTGKTMVAAHFIFSVIYKLLNKKTNPRILWIAPSNELLIQAHSLILEERNLSKSFEIESPNIDNKFGRPSPKKRYNIMFKTIPAVVYNNNLKILSKMNIDLLVIDEAHWGAGRKNKMVPSILKEFNNSFLLGLTATPFRTDQDPYIFKKYYKNRYIKMDMDDLKGLNRELIRAKVIPEEVKTGYKIVLKKSDPWKAHVEFNKKISGFNKPEINNIIVKHWNKDKYGRTLIFAIDIDHANNLAERFLKTKSNIKVQIIHSNEIPTSLLKKIVVKPSEVKEERSGKIYKVFNYFDRGEIQNKFRQGEIDVLISVNMYLMGVDVPKIETLFIARPTLSPIIYIQMVGRGRRGPAFGGTSEIFVVDFTTQVKTLTKLKSMHYALYQEIREQRTEYPSRLCKNKYKSIIKPKRKNEFIRTIKKKSKTFNKPNQNKSTVESDRRKWGIIYEKHGWNGLVKDFGIRQAKIIKDILEEEKLEKEMNESDKIYQKKGWQGLVKEYGIQRAKDIKDELHRNKKHKKRKKPARSNIRESENIYKRGGWQGLVKEYGIQRAKELKDRIENKPVNKKGMYYCKKCRYNHEVDSNIGRRHRK